ncbi:hypothetical protein PybrP1_011855, partial [[Pythium] brassicae (nom. inval.)]
YFVAHFKNCHLKNLLYRFNGHSEEENARTRFGPRRKKDATNWFGQLKSTEKRMISMQDNKWSEISERDCWSCRLCNDGKTDLTHVFELSDVGRSQAILHLRQAHERVFEEFLRRLPAVETGGQLLLSAAATKAPAARPHALAKAPSRDAQRSLPGSAQSHATSDDSAPSRVAAAVVEMVIIGERAAATSPRSLQHRVAEAERSRQRRQQASNESRQVEAQRSKKRRESRTPAQRQADYERRKRMKKRADESERSRKRRDDATDESREHESERSRERRRNATEAQRKREAERSKQRRQNASEEQRVKERERSRKRYEDKKSVRRGRGDTDGWSQRSSSSNRSWRSASEDDGAED